MKRKGLVFLLCLSLLCLAGCHHSGEAAKRYVAVITKSADSDFFEKMHSGAETAATQYHLTVSFEAPRNEEDYESQNRMIEKAVENGADAILLSAIDYEKNSDAVNNAVRKGVKVLTVDSDVRSDLTSQFIGTDNREAGRVAAQAAVNCFSKETLIRIGVVSFTESTENGKMREEGFREAIRDVPNAEVVDFITCDSSVQSAEEAALSLIERYPQINVLVGMNEWMTLGVGNAIQNSGCSDRVAGIGFDSNPQSISLLESGDMKALIVQNPFAMGYLGIQSAAELLSGETPDSADLFTEVIPVTRENLYDRDIQKLLFRL